MFAIIGSLFKIAFYSFFVHEYVQHKFPEKYKEYLILASYKLIYLYSKGQITFFHANKYVQKFHKIIKNKINKYKNLENTQKTNDIEYIFNGKQIYKTDNFLDVQKPLEYDFIIISDNINKEHSYTNKRILKKLEDWNDLVEESNVKFILVEVLCKNQETQNPKQIKIDFKTDNYNFYVVNNVFDEKFIIYFLTTYYSEEVKDVELQNISITILDANIVNFEYNIKNDYIYITKTAYFRKSDIITED